MPLATYEILRDGLPVTKMDHTPQTTKSPFVVTDKTDDASHEYVVAINDIAGRSVKSEAVRVDAI